MRYFNYILSVCFFGIVVAAQCQQRPIQSLYMFDPLLLNPAYAGTHVQLSATSIYRNQWINLDGAPRTFTTSVHSGFRKSKVGVGLIIANDQIGIHNDLSVYGVYAYHINLGRSTMLSMGLQGGVNDFRSDYNKLKLKDSNDPNLNGVLQKFNPNVGAGLYLRHKYLVAGFSVPYMINNKVQDITNVQSYSRQRRYYYATLGWMYRLSDNVQVFPNLLARFQERAPFTIDLNSTIVFYKKVGLGVSYRLNDSVMGLFQLQLNDNFHVGYAYDFTTSELNQFSNGTHEIMINYRVKIKKLHTGLRCPTYWDAPGGQHLEKK